MGKVFVIGAGCPRGAGICVPLAPNIFRWAVSRNQSLPDFMTDEGETRDRDKLHILSSIGVDVQGMKRDEPPFEQILTRLSKFIHVNSPTAFEPMPEFINRTCDRYVAQELRKELFDFLCELLRPSIQLVHKGIPSRLTKLCQKMDPRKDSVISFNYDTLLEIALTKANLLDSERCYHVSFNHVWRNGSLKPMTLPSEWPGMAFLKLHGSINWLKCFTPKHGATIDPPSQEGTLALVPADHPFAWTGYTAEIERGSSYLWEIFAIPAATDKQEYFQERPEIGMPLWEKARDALLNADEIVVIGYSLSDTDAQSREVFHNVLSSGNARLKTLHVADTSKAVLEKYRRMLGGKGIGFRGYPGGLADFLGE